MQKKYEFTGETKRFDDVIFKRIRRISDGQIGGWIEKEENLSHEGECFLYGNGRAFENAQVSGDALIVGNAQAFGNSKIGGNAQLGGDSKVSGNTEVSGNANINLTMYIHSNSIVTKSPLFIQGLYQKIVKVDNGIFIGCQFKTKEEWLALSYEDALEYDSGLKLEDYEQIKKYIEFI